MGDLMAAAGTDIRSKNKVWNRKKLVIVESRVEYNHSTIHNKEDEFRGLGPPPNNDVAVGGD